MTLAKITIDPPVIAQLPAPEQKLAYDFSLTVPGGAVVSLPSAAGAGVDECTLILDYGLPSITLSMAPFGFIFCLADIAIKIKAVLDAVTDAIGGNPTAFNTALSNLATALVCVTSAIPTLSVPQFMRDMIDYLDAMLSCLIDTLNGLKTNVDNLASTLSGAASGSILEVNLNAGLTTVNGSLSSLIVQLKPLQPIFTMMNTLLALISLGPVSFTQPSDPGVTLDPTALKANIDDIITPLQTLQGTLATLRAALP